MTEDKNCVGSGALNLGIPPPICGDEGGVEIKAFR